jgi:hypothetical protein
VISGERGDELHGSTLKQNASLSARLRRVAMRSDHAPASQEAADIPVDIRAVADDPAEETTTKLRVKRVEAEPSQSLHSPLVHEPPSPLPTSDVTAGATTRYVIVPGDGGASIEEQAIVRSEVTRRDIRVRRVEEEVRRARWAWLKLGVAAALVLVAIAVVAFAHGRQSAASHEVLDESASR